MRKDKIDYQHVVKAADKLKAIGEKPSIVNVQKELGIYNTNHDLPKMLERWYSEQPEFQRKNLPSAAVDILERNVELEKNISLVRATLEATADGILMINNQGQVVDWNRQFADMWRIPTDLLEAGPEALCFEYILDQVNNPDDLVKEVQHLYNNPEATRELGELHFKDGRIFERYSQPHRVGDAIVGRVWSFRDVTQRKLAEAQLRIRERAIEASSQGIFIIDVKQAEHPIIYINSSFEKITGFDEHEVLGKNLSLLQGFEKDQANLKRIELAMRENQEEEVEIRCYRKNGEVFWNELHLTPVPNTRGDVTHFIGIMNDITERKELEQQLIKQATHDLLTNLPNRVLLMDRVVQAINNAKRTKKKVAMLFLDLDRFKLVNDSLGHSTGDLLLQEVANRLLIATRDGDTVARIGGDEFVVILSELDKEEQAVTMAQAILAAVAKPYKIENKVLNITASIGVSSYPRDGMTYEILMKNADLSMYYAKDAGRNNVKVYIEEMNKKVVDRIELETALHNALALHEFEVHYQPLVDINTKKIIGNEALLRWNNAKLGMISPVQFIPIAEETGLILDIGTWVLEQACRQTKLWQQQGYTDLSIAVNLSGRQFEQKNLVNIIKETLAKTGLAPKYLEVELTESLLIEDLSNTVNVLYQLKDMGVKIAIDDFGTGYSSLSYLKQFPVDKLKIDRSFICELFQGKGNNEEAIVLAIINLAHSLKLKSLAEGVETEAQLQFLRMHQCDLAQGYYFYKPQNAQTTQQILQIDR